MTHMSSWGRGADEPGKGRYKAVRKKKNALRESLDMELTVRTQQE